MKKENLGKSLCRLIMAVAIMTFSLQAMAYDFAYTYQGKELYYKITSDSTVDVTCYSFNQSDNNHVSGEVVIPSSLEYNGTTYSVTSIGSFAFAGCSGLTSVTAPNSITLIGQYAFSDCSGLTSVSLRNGIISISHWAFLNCTALTSINIPNSVTVIGEYAFFGCSGLVSVNIPDGVTALRDGTFRNCSGLTAVTIGNGIISIKKDAFSGCTGLTTLNFNAINCQDFSADSNMFGISLTTLTIGDSVQRIPANFVRYCNALTFVTIPDRVTEIGHDAFRNCGGLIAAILGNGVSNIGNNAFKDCSYLTYLTIGRSLERIEDSAFANCSLLTSITSLASVPPVIVSSNVFAYPTDCTVTVPCGSLGVYTEQTNRWNLLFNGRITEGLSFELSLSANDEAYGRVETDTLSCAGRTLIATSNEGYEFTGWNDGNTENPRMVTVTSDTAFMAIFTEAETTPTITVTVNDATMGSAAYTIDGNTAVLTATPNEGYEFSGWNDGNTENPRTVTVTSDTAFMAIFTASSSSSLQAVNAREFTLYPNPAKSFVTLEFEASEENTLLQILDLNGRMVRMFDLKAGVETLRINLGDLPKGVYTIMLGSATKKLVVE